MTTCYFGKIPIPLSQIFLLKPLCFGFVNLRPVAPGHVLLSPRRVVARFKDLSDNEALELLIIGQEISRFIEFFYKRSSEICIQDGEAAGQSINHVHMHIIPRAGDEKNLIVDSERKDRSKEEMEIEAEIYREVLNDLKGREGS